MFRKTERMRVVTIINLTLLLLVCAIQNEAQSAESAEEASAAPVQHSVKARVSTEDGDDDSPDAEHHTNESVLNSILSKLSIHGHCSQAFATAHYVEIPEDVPEGIAVHRPSALEATLGIPEDGTTEYRNLALQVRYHLTPHDVFTIQLSSEEAGFSPIAQMKDEIQIGWAYYEHRFKRLKAKVGRIPIPKGIYNEIRDVGTILPFFHPPWSIYLEGVFANEVVDGVAFYNTFWPQSEWNLDAAIWGGSYEVFGGDPNDPNSFIQVHSDEVFGGQLWLSALAPEVRFGAFSSRANIGDAGFFQDLEMSSYIISVEASLSRFVFRGEWMHDDWDFSLPFGPLSMNFHNYYGQVGYQVSPKFQIWLQVDTMTGAHQGDLLLGGKKSREKFRESTGISLVYQLRSDLVLRAEHHLVGETQTFIMPVVAPDGIRADRLVVHRDHGDYSIVSLSVAF